MMQEHLKHNTIILLNPGLGFTYSYMILLWNRICRANVSFLAEASSILLSCPDATVGSPSRRGGKQHMQDDGLARWISQLIFIYLRYQEGNYTFNVDDPVPVKDKEYDVKLKDTHIIFNEPEKDPLLLKKYQPLHVVTDGNIPLARKICDDERVGLKRLQGRPKSKKKISRCAAVSEHENINTSRVIIGGLFVTVNMQTAPGGHGNQILQMAEMKNSENKAYKISLLKALRSKKVGRKHIRVGKYAHDCGCTLIDDIEGSLVEKVYLDGYHGRKHKCKTPLILKEKFPRLNSVAAEQLWGRMEGLQKTISCLPRPRYRMFLKHYCKWRNWYTSKKCRNDLNPCVSKRRVIKRFKKRVQ